MNAFTGMLAGFVIAAGLVATRRWGHSAWRWLVWPQIGLAGAASWAAYQGLLPLELLRWPLADKVLHFLLFGSVAFWLHLWLGGRTARLGRLAVPLALAVPLLVATVDEIAQGFSARRSLDLGDWLCNLAGLLVFWRLSVWLTRREGRAGAVVGEARLPSH
mgnify:CR=1 FL=1